MGTITLAAPKNGWPAVKPEPSPTQTAPEVTRRDSGQMATNPPATAKARGSDRVADYAHSASISKLHRKLSAVPENTATIEHHPSKQPRWSPCPRSPLRLYRQEGGGRISSRLTIRRPVTCGERRDESGEIRLFPANFDEQTANIERSQQICLAKDEPRNQRT